MNDNSEPMEQSLKAKAADLRRSHILSAAIHVFGERGFHRATIRDVADRAGVSDGTIYNSFANKDALLLAALDPLNEAAQALSPLIDSMPDLRSLLQISLQRRFSALTDDQLLLHRVVLSEALINPSLRTLYFDRVLSPTFAGAGTLFSTHPPGDTGDADFASRSLTAIVLGFVMLRLLGDPVTGALWGELGGQLATLLLDGLTKSQEAENGPD